MLSNVFSLSLLQVGSCYLSPFRARVVFFTAQNVCFNRSGIFFCTLRTHSSSINSSSTSFFFVPPPPKSYKKKTQAEGRKNIPTQGRIGVQRRARAGLNEEKKKIQLNFWHWIRWKNTSDPPETTYFSMNSEKHSMSHNARGTNTDEITQERRHASSCVRRPQPLFFCRRRQGSYHSLGGGRRKMPSAELRRRCSYRSLERILLGLSLGSLLCGIYTYWLSSQLFCCVSRTQNQYKCQCLYQYVPSLGEEHYGSC